MVRRYSVVTLALVGLMSLPAAATSGADPARPHREAPLTGTQHADAIPDRYIVVFGQDVPEETVQAARDRATSRGAVVHHEYADALNGFAATLPADALAELRSNPGVEFIEADKTVAAAGTQPNPPSWGLDRVDQRTLPLNTSYHYDFGGSGVTAYIVDTGMDLDHPDFAGRVTSGYDAVDGGGADDCNGHGTHVAGTVGGSTFGIAKTVSLVAVRVLNCQGSGTISQVVAGINYVTGNHLAGQPAVASLALYGGPDVALDDAVNNSISDGVTYAVTAGNDNTSACNYSPSRVPAAITPGATTITDARSSFSNYGTCLDLFAPGSNITSDWLNAGTNTISGASMAAAHVAGAATLLLQQTPSLTPAALRDAMVENATPDVVTAAGTGSPNRLLYTLSGSPPPPPPPPPADFDGSGTTDRSVFRSNGGWYVKDQPTVFHGLPGDIPVPADYDGDGDVDKAVYRNGAWYIKDQTTQFHGLASDIPVPADYNNDGDAELAVFRPSTGAWLVKNQSTVFLGTSTDVPVPVDYDGDGDADRAVYRPSTGAWFVHNQTTVFFGGVSGDIPVPGDYDNDGDADRAVFRSNGGWYVSGQATQFFGLSGDKPMPGDYDGDGDIDRAVYRNGAWHVKDQPPVVFFGLATDRPLPLPHAIYDRYF